LVVRFKTKAEYAGSVTPSALNTETTVLDLPAQAEAFLLEGYVSCQNLASGETAVVRMYVAVDGANRVVYDEVTVSGDYAQKVVHFTAMNLRKNALPRVTVTQTAGTLRAFPYWFVVMVYEVI
jgi:hypothetical protein